MAGQRGSSYGPTSFGEKKGEDGSLSGTNTGTISVKKGFATRGFKHRLTTVRHFYFQTSKIPSTKSFAKYL